MSNASTIAVVAIMAIVITGYGSYYFSATPLDAQVSSYQTSVSSYQSVVSSMSAHPSTTTKFSTVFSTVTSVSTYTYRINQVPSSALVVTQESYNNATKTITMTVQNTENYTVYAQISATMIGNPCCGYGSTAGSYSSSVFQFNPMTKTPASFSLTWGNYYGDCVGHISTVSLQFVSAVQSSDSQASGTYNFEISPSYQSPYQVCP